MPPDRENNEKIVLIKVDRHASNLKMKMKVMNSKNHIQEIG